jgi:chitodextrinase
VLAVPALADPSVPTGLTAVVRSDHTVDLSWSWPSPTTYPDDLQVWRNGVDVTSVPLTSTTFTDTTPSPGTAYTYQLVTVNAGLQTMGPSIVAPPTRADAPNPATNITVSFAPVTNIATVLFTRGPEDADVTYNVIATQVGGGVVGTSTERYSDVGTAGSATMDVFTSYTSYTFQINAVEDSGDPPSDPGQTTPSATTSPKLSNDTSSPSFLVGVLSAARISLGTIHASWPSATDSGTGVDHYSACVDSTCQPVTFDPIALTASALLQNVPNDGQLHTVSVVAIDGAGNTSIMLTTPVNMPVLAAPQITFAGHTDGCGPLIPTVSSTDGTAGTPAGLNFPIQLSSGQLSSSGEVTGDPYTPVTITAEATFGSDTSAPASNTALINDPDGPTDSPAVHGQSDPELDTETISWLPITAVGAPVIGYQVTSLNIPGYALPEGRFVGQSTQPQVTFTNLDPTVRYQVSVNAVDACEQLSPQTEPTTFWINDVTPPSTPGNVTATVTGRGTSVHLAWARSTDDVQVDYYKVTRDGTTVYSTSGTSFDDPSLADATTYTYRVVAVDTSGQPSKPSAAATITTKDLTPPTPTGNVIPSGTGGTVTLRWGAASDNVGVAGYQVSRDGQPAKTVPAPIFVDTNVPAGLHEWDVVAFDAAGNRSSSRGSTPLMTTGTPKATSASLLRIVPSKGVKSVRIGGKSGSRLVLSFKLTEQFSPAVLRLHVLSGKAKLRVSLPSGAGRTTPGVRLAERPAKKGTLLIPIGNMHPQTLKIVVTSSAGKLVTLAGPKGSKAPMIVPKS